MPAISEVLINSQTHPSLNVDPITVTGDPVKGDGYYGWGDGVHTVGVELTGFVGDILIQATLETDPTTDDWFTVPLLLTESDQFSVDTTGLVSKITNTSQFLQFTTTTTTVKVYNFIGNFVWIRGIIDNWTAGTVNRILFNH